MRYLILPRFLHNAPRKLASPVTIEGRAESSNIRCISEQCVSVGMWGPFSAREEGLFLNPTVKQDGYWAPYVPDYCLAKRENNQSLRNQRVG